MSWVEIVEPGSGDLMFANLESGECRWQPPSDAHEVRRADANQWWQLFDDNTNRHNNNKNNISDMILMYEVSLLNRYYYYNASEQRTVWERPSAADCDIIPLSKLQAVANAANKEESKSRVEAKHCQTQTKDNSVTRRDTCNNNNNNSVKLKRRAMLVKSSSAQTTPQRPSFSSAVAASRRSHRPVHARHRRQASAASRVGSEASTEERSSPQHPSLTHSDRMSTNGMTTSSTSSPSKGFVPKRRGTMDSVLNGSEPTFSPTSQSRVAMSSTVNRSQSMATSTPPVRHREAERRVSNPLSPDTFSSLSELVDSGLSTLNDTPSMPQTSSQVIPQVTAQQPGPSRWPPQRRSGGVGRAARKLSLDGVSELQRFILEQQQRSNQPDMSGDRDSFIESEDDLINPCIIDSADDFADDEDGGLDTEDDHNSSSVVGDDDDSSPNEDERFLTEPTYNNLEPLWLANPDPIYHTPPLPPPMQAQGLVASKGVNMRQPETDALSEEFDLRMRMSAAPLYAHPYPSPFPRTSTMPRSHRPSQQFPPHAPPPPPPSELPMPYEVLHPSLQRHTVSKPPASLSHMPAFSTTNCTRLPVNKVQQGSTLSVSTSIHSTMSCESDIEKYAVDFFNVHRKRGLIFRRKMALKDVLAHTRQSLKKPITCLEDKVVKKEAIETFKLIQIYMSDRRAKPGMSVNSVALELLSKGFSEARLRDELFVQLCKQTTENPNRESLRRGWELMAIALAFFPPSTLFYPALWSYVEKHRSSSLDCPDVAKWPLHVQISHYASICLKRLERMGPVGKLSPRRPGIEDIDQSRLQIFRPSMFGGTLSETMAVQRERFPQRRIPWVLTTLAEQILQLNGAGTEGIFRVSADVDEVNAVKSRIDQWEIPNCGDCHTAASLLKLWLRELYEPVIPDALYKLCLEIGEDVSRVTEVTSRLPALNSDVLCFLIRYLQLFARPDVATMTKMDASNLATIFAPNLLRCPSEDPAVILESARREMSFVKTLIFTWDTSRIEGIL